MTNHLTPAEIAEYKYQVPVGATIPAGMQFLICSANSLTRCTTSRNVTTEEDDLSTWWTKEQLYAPTDWDEAMRKVRESGEFLEVNGVIILPGNAQIGLLSEWDKRPRRDRDGDKVVWEAGAWRYYTTGAGCAFGSSPTLAEYNSVVSKIVGYWGGAE